MRFFHALVLVVSLVDVVNADPGQMPPTDVSRWITFFDKLVDTVVRSEAETCDRLALDVSGVLDAHKTTITMARVSRAAGKRLPEAAQRHMLDEAKRMAPTFHRCGTHDKVRAAFAKLDLGAKR